MQPPRFSFSQRRTLLTSMIALIVVLGLLALPPVRAAADQLLQVFRVQTVMFVPIDRDRMEQLRDLNFDKDTLFISKPNVVNGSPEPHAVASVEEASNAVGFAVQQPSAFPSAPSETKIMVQDRLAIEAQVNVQAARSLLTMMDVTDVTIPDALGASPIKADLAPSVMTSYKGADYEISLLQGRSPELSLPDGVDLAQLGKAALRLLGMESSQADTLSRQIDWSSTLVVPIPTDINDVRRVTINGANGMLVGAGRGRSNHSVLYWQQGDRFFVLQVHGNLGDPELITAAESVR